MATAILGLLIVLIALGRLLDVSAFRTRRWPGSFASGGVQKRREVIALGPLGFGFLFFGAAEAIMMSNRALAGLLMGAAAVTFISAIFLFGRALLRKT